MKVIVVEKINSIFKNLKNFANKHNLILETKGECGLGRPCVGFLFKTNYVGYNPVILHYIYVWDEDVRLCPPEEVKDAYHKHPCMAVLVHNDNCEEAFRQLNEWVKSLENHGKVFIDSYETGATGIQAGKVGYAIRLKK